MSHQNLASVWSTLHCRADIDNIVQELIGRYFLDIADHTADRGHSRSIAFSHVVALRTIFDLQRTYLQSPDPSFESKTSILNSDLLLSTIKHLLGIKASMFNAHDGLPNHDGYCSYIGQTLVSGIRVLHLQNRRLSLSEHKTIMKKFEMAWGKETLRGVDHFSINLFCHRMVAELSNIIPNPRLSSPTPDLIQLQDFYRGLYPLDENLDAFADATNNAIALSRSSADWFHCALVLYDISWAATGAMIQMCMDNQYYEGLSYSNLAGESVMLTLTPRFKMLNTLFKDSTSHPPPTELEWAFEQTQTTICMGVQAKCFGQACICLGPDSKYVQDLWDLHISKEATTAMAKCFEKISNLEIEPMLKSLRKTLESRHAILADVGKEHLDMSQKILEFTHEWCPELPKNRRYDSRGNNIPDDIYILNCPELHSIPGKVLEENLALKLRQEHFQVLKNIPGRRGCNQCARPAVAITIRKIEPLSKMAEYIQEKLKDRRAFLSTKFNITKISHNATPSPPRQGRPLLARRVEHTRRNKSSDNIKLEVPNIVNTLQPINESPNSQAPEPLLLHRHTMSTLEMRPGTKSPFKSASPTTTYSYAGSSSTPSYFSDTLSRTTSRTFSPPPFPTQEETTNLPEVAVPRKPKPPTPASSHSGQSDAGSSIFQPVPRKWVFKTRRGMKGTSNIPSAAFFVSGRTLLLWNDRGACCYDLENMLSISYQIITPGDILLAAGGTRRSGMVCRSGPMIVLRIFQIGVDRPMQDMEIESIPFAMALSTNDHYIALKFGSYVRILDIVTGATFHHKLPSLSGRSGPKDHLVAFSTDCLSFAATTRCEPERVLTYFSTCQSPSNGDCVESIAPYGLVSDDGLSSLVVSENSAFLTTFTEKGYPSYLTLLSGRASSRVLRDKNSQVGSRIHSTAICATGQNLVIFNDRNEVFWIETPFGKERAPTRVGSIKRDKSVKREVELALPNTTEAYVFWIYKGKGVLVTMGKGEGKSKPIELDIDIDHLLESE